MKGSMMRLSPLALALAFGAAKVIVGIFTYAASILTIWSISATRYGILAPSWGMHATFSLQFILVQLLVFGFLGGALAGALAAVIYNNVISKRSSAI